MPVERRFTSTPETILKDLGSVLRKIGAEKARIETAAKISKEFTRQLSRIGVAVVWADPTIMPSPGVRLSFERDGLAFPYQCGKWASVLDNLRACQRTVSALYMIYEDYGVTGEAATPEGANESFVHIMALGSGEFRWWDVLGVAKTAGKVEIRAAYNALAKMWHPDNTVTGSHEQMQRLNRAYEEAMQR